MTTTITSEEQPRSYGQKIATMISKRSPSHIATLKELFLHSQPGALPLRQLVSCTRRRCKQMETHHPVVQGRAHGPHVTFGRIEKAVHGRAHHVRDVHLIDLFFEQIPCPPQIHHFVFAEFRVLRRVHASGAAADVVRAASLSGRVLARGWIRARQILQRETGAGAAVHHVERSEGGGEDVCLDEGFHDAVGIGVRNKFSLAGSGEGPEDVHSVDGRAAVEVENEPGREQIFDWQSTVTQYTIEVEENRPE